MVGGDANKTTVTEYFERLLNAGDLASTLEILQADARFHYPLGDLEGAEEIREYLATVREAFPDIHFSILDLFGEGDLVACRWSLRGTQAGEFAGKTGTGKQVSVPGNTIFRCSNGRIQEMWVAFNPARLV